MEGPRTPRPRESFGALGKPRGVGPRVPGTPAIPRGAALPGLGAPRRGSSLCKAPRERLGSLVRPGRAPPTPAVRRPRSKASAARKQLPKGGHLGTRPPRAQRRTREACKSRRVRLRQTREPQKATDKVLSKTYINVLYKTHIMIFPIPAA